MALVARAPERSPAAQPAPVDPPPAPTRWPSATRASVPAGDPAGVSYPPPRRRSAACGAVVPPPVEGSRRPDVDRRAHAHRLSCAAQGRRSSDCSVAGVQRRCAACGGCSRAADPEALGTARTLVDPVVAGRLDPGHDREPEFGAGGSVPAAEHALRQPADESSCIAELSTQLPTGPIGAHSRSARNCRW